MKDAYLCIMAGVIGLCYIVYMVYGPGGDGIIFASLVGAVCALAGVQYGKQKATAATEGQEAP